MDLPGEVVFRCRCGVMVFIPEPQIERQVAYLLGRGLAAPAPRTGRHVMPQGRERREGGGGGEGEAGGEEKAGGEDKAGSSRRGETGGGERGSRRGEDAREGGSRVEGREGRQHRSSSHHHHHHSRRSSSSRHHSSRRDRRSSSRRRSSDRRDRREEEEEDRFSPHHRNKRRKCSPPRQDEASAAATTTAFPRMSLVSAVAATKSAQLEPENLIPPSSPGPGAAAAATTTSKPAVKEIIEVDLLMSSDEDEAVNISRLRTPRDPSPILSGGKENDELPHRRIKVIEAGNDPTVRKKTRPLKFDPKKVRALKDLTNK